MLTFLFSVSLSVLVFLILYGFLRQTIRQQQELSARVRSLGETATRPQLRQRRREGRAGGQRSMKDIPFVERVIRPALESMQKRILSMTPRAISEAAALKLALAGKSRQMKPATFLIICFISAVALGALTFMLLMNSPKAFVQKVVFQILGVVFGGFLPLVILDLVIKKRQEAILRQLPEVLDLLCVSVQAGLSFDASLSKITERMVGPLIDEFRRFQEDIHMGMLRRNAMKNLSTRCGVQEVSLFMTSLIQAERLGASLGKTLKDQADNMRERRRQYIKAQAMKAPVKIVFPLILFIFPALFVVILVPTAMSLMKNL